MTIRIASNDVEIELLALVRCPTSRLYIGTSVGDVYVWADDGRLVQTLFLQALPGHVNVFESADGRATLVAVDPLDTGGRGAPPVYVRTYDLVTGVLRWRRKDKLGLASSQHELLGRRVLRVAGPQGAHVFDFDTGLRVRARGAMTSVPPVTRVQQVPDLELPAPPSLPETTARRDLAADVGSAADRAIGDARRAFFYGRDTPAPVWSQTDPSPTVWGLIQELRRIDGKRPIAEIPAELRTLDLPLDVQALFAADSAWLRTRWGIDRTLVAKHQQVAADVELYGVRAFGMRDDVLLCAQATPLGDRVGIYKYAYRGPLPLATLLGELVWERAESRRPMPTEDWDLTCERMAGYLERVLRAG